MTGKGSLCAAPLVGRARIYNNKRSCPPSTTSSSPGQAPSSSSSCSCPLPSRRRDRRKCRNARSPSSPRTPKIPSSTRHGGGARLEGVTCLFTGPETMNATEQADIISDLASGGGNVSGIAVSAIDAGITGAAIDAAVAAGVPVVTFDSDAPGSGRRAYVGTDDFEMGHSLAWLLFAAGPSEGGRYAVISSSGENLARREEGVRFKLRETFGHVNWTEVEGSPTDCEDRIDLALEQCKELVADNPSSLDAIVSVGGWPMWDEAGFEEFAAENPDLLFLSADSLPSQMRLLDGGYAQGLVGQNPKKMGELAMDVLFELATNSSAVVEEFIHTGEQVFLKQKADIGSDEPTSSSDHVVALGNKIVLLTLIAFSASLSVTQ